MRRSRFRAPRALLLCVTLTVFIVGIARAENLIHNGDFELDSDRNPPPGWTMWGPQASKDPAHFTRHTSNPYEGSACLRIYHPAGGANYIVSSPDHAIRARSGKAYVASFRARADSPGPARFGFTAYEHISPYVDAPSPGWFVIEVGQEWKRFEFTVYEGQDFFADESRLLLLTFKPTTDESRERTLWIDDVRVTEKPSPKGRLINPAKLDYPSLKHRLDAGQELDFAVDAARRRPANRRIGGISFHRVAGWTRHPYNREGEYTLHPAIEKAIRDLRLPMTRFYAVGDEPFGVEAAIDKAARMCRRADIPTQHTPLELEVQSAETKLPPETWALAVRHARQQGYGFRRWEVGNEPYAILWREKTAFPQPDDYIEHFKAVSQAIQNVDPDAQVGLPIHRGSQEWGNSLLKQLAGRYDFVVPHYYVFPNVRKTPFADIVLTENFRVMDTIRRVDALIDAYNPDRDVYQYDTEWGLHGSGPHGEHAGHVRRNGNIIGTLHRAVRLIYYAREDLVHGASSWEMLTRVDAPGFGILTHDAPHDRFMIYWLYYYFNRHVGTWALAMDGTAPYHTPAEDRYPDTPPGPLTPALVTLSEDESEIYAVLANGSWERKVPCRIRFQSFPPGDARAVILSDDDPDAHPLVRNKEDFVSDFDVDIHGRELQCELPPHSVVFITIRGR